MFRRLLLAALLLAVVDVAGCVPPPPRLVVGVAHDRTALPLSPAAAGYLAGVPVQAVSLMGWGAGNPEPSPGVYDWTSLDAEVAAVVAVGAEPVLELAGAPDWLKGGPAGSTDWTRLEVAPTDVAGFAQLAAVAAARYPQVRRFVVWNEFKGMWDSARNRFDLARYENLFDAVARAVRAVRPDALLGGPYVPVQVWSSAATMSNPSALAGPWGVVDQRALDALAGFLAHGGADFLVVDGWLGTVDRGQITDPTTGAAVFGAVTSWIRSRTSLPVWWAELHVADAVPGWPLATQAAAAGAALQGLNAAGAAVALLWQPQALGAVCSGCLFTDPAVGPVMVTPLGSAVLAWP